MAFNKNALKWASLYVTINGQRKTMKVADMNDAQIKTALGRPDNAGALADGWKRASNGEIQYAGIPVPGQGSTTTTQKPTTTAAQDQQAANTAQQQTQQAIPQVQTPVIVPENPAVTGPGQAQIAAALKSARVNAAGLNGQISDLTANNYGKYNSRLNTLNRDATINRHDYNAQSNASGFRRSGGVRTNNNIVNAAASTGQRDLYDAYGEGAVNKLKTDKQAMVHNTLQGLLGNWMAQLNPNAYGDI